MTPWIAPRSLEQAREPAVLTVIDAVLDPASCRALIDEVSDDSRWLTTTAELTRPVSDPLCVPPRRIDTGNDAPCRLVGCGARPSFSLVDDPILALRLFYRLAPHLPDSLHGAPLAGLKPVLRCVHLGEGEATEPHRDPVRECVEGMRSGLSLALFLNDDFRGGALHFPEIGRVIQARAGRAVLFSQELLHVDGEVESGDRYLLEGEIFYAPGWRHYRQ